VLVRDTPATKLVNEDARALELAKEPSDQRTVWDEYCSIVLVVVAIRV
jgi:hypothetical protein